LIIKALHFVGVTPFFIFAAVYGISNWLGGRADRAPQRPLFPDQPKNSARSR
jgi:hypothetical protein